MSNYPQHDQTVPLPPHALKEESEQAKFAPYPVAPLATLKEQAKKLAVNLGDRRIDRQARFGLNIVLLAWSIPLLTILAGIIATFFRYSGASGMPFVLIFGVPVISGLLAAITLPINFIALARAAHAQQPQRVRNQTFAGLMLVLVPILLFFIFVVMPGIRR